MYNLCLVKFRVIRVMCSFFCFFATVLVNNDEYICELFAVGILVKLLFVSFIT